ncbi:hypothetical protein EVG20_g10276 [Dentipellis fragilis]|uniref:Uncharacterized protein n=1 Tax=Dentipellis fragilis TaxID=205917 RepID=A0A4Y9XVA0_9AGAM|nr:hypothetical protein EVG20_g10276 [Dentipellis fragilis]
MVRRAIFEAVQGSPADLRSHSGRVSTRLHARPPAPSSRPLASLPTATLPPISLPPRNFPGPESVARANSAGDCCPDRLDARRRRRRVILVPENRTTTPSSPASAFHSDGQRRTNAEANKVEILAIANAKARDAMRDLLEVPRRQLRARSGKPRRMPVEADSSCAVAGSMDAV